ncbi:MAG: hypothetical protein ACRYG7_01180, partial [Janthinobacterium lividum]
NLSIELVFKNYREIFPGASKIGDLLSKLSTSYISSFIFYFIVVHTKSERDKENVNEFIGHNIYSIITCAHLFIQPLQQVKEEKARFENFDLQQLKRLLYSIKRNDKKAPLIIDNENATWLQWFEYLKGSIEENLRVIFLRYNHLDSKLIKILSRIEASIFFTQWNLLYDYGRDDTFAMYEFQIRTFLKHIKDLEEYANKNMKQYQYRSGEFMGTTTVL